ncbi:MAG TPA: ABC transporter permease [Pyrinomonadaceae bacterium]|nr:ABC transporter permease [Pyrinomonadaceae bacterium]
MWTFWQDVRYGMRMLVKTPSFTVITVLTLALGVGANTAIFSLVNAVLVRPLKYVEPERLVMVWESDAISGFDQDTPAAATYADWKAQNQVFEDMAVQEMRSLDLTGEGEPEKLTAFAVTANFFPLLGAQPALGRNFLAEEDKPGANKVAIISHALWQNRFAGDANVVGRDIALNGEKHRVIGVMPRDFQFRMPDVKVWTPVAFTAEQLSNRDLHYLEIVARLKPGVTVEQANADIRAITARIAAAYPDQARNLSGVVVPLREQFVGGARRTLLLLLVAVGFVLLIACANIAGVLLSRAATRQREIAVRAALGASRWRIVRQLLTESLLLGGLGGALGLLLAMWTLAFLQQLVPAGLRESTELSLDAPVLVFTLAVSLLAGMIFGLAPALQASRIDLNDALKSATGGAGTGRGQRRLRSAFVVAEVALAMVLLVGAGLLIQSLMNLRGQYSGLQPDDVLTMRTQLSARKYREHEQRVGFYDQVLARVKNLPGVEAAGYTTTVPLVWGGGANGLAIEGRADDPNVGYNANHRQVSPDYFKAIGVAVKRGRAFDERDDERAVRVAVVNETMARQFWPGEDPVGKRFKVATPDTNPWLTIVGIVSDIRQVGMDVPPKAEMYVPYRQAERGVPYTLFVPRDLVVRTTVTPTELAASVRAAVREVDPNQPVANVRTLDEVLGRVTAQRRLGMNLLSAFAALGLLLAALGIYGVLSYFVVQHTREIGVRMALGAQAGDVLRLVIGRGVKLALAGIVVGLVGAFLLTRLIESLLFGVSAIDPLTFAGVTVALASVAVLACYIPARRATRVDPMVALRYE